MRLRTRRVRRVRREDVSDSSGISPRVIARTQTYSIALPLYGIGIRRDVGLLTLVPDVGEVQSCGRAIAHGKAISSTANGLCAQAAFCTATAFTARGLGAQAPSG
jgi:hypothetical protein